MLYTDNFFTSVKLYKCLRALGIGACGTAKAGSGYPASLLALRDATTKKNNWGLKAYTVVDDEVLCMAWVDNNTVQLMTTAYDISDIDTPYLLPPKRRLNIPEDSVQYLPPPYLPSIAAHSILTNQSDQSGLPVPYPIKKYNLHMGGSDGNAQQRATYSFDRRSPKYWWPLFTFLHDATCLNAYILYKSCDHQDSKILSREAFIRSIAMTLITAPAGNGRKRKSQADDLPVGTVEFLPEHQWVFYPKKSFCDRCKANKSRSSKRKREPLTEVDGNNKKRRMRGSQTHWGCGAFSCQKLRACKKAECWNYIHMGADSRR